MARLCNLRISVRRATQRWTLVSCVAVFGMQLGTGPAHADYLEGGMSTPVFSIRTYGVNDTWANWFNGARHRWNDTPTPASIRRTIKDVPRDITAGRYDDSWLGNYKYAGTRERRTFLIRVNARRLAEEIEPGGRGFALAAIGTSVHELGHALSLADNPETSRSSIMKYSKPLTRTHPYGYDIDEVNRIY